MENAIYLPDSLPTTRVHTPEPLLHYVEQPNRWMELRHRFRKPLAEFMGTMILIIFGSAVGCQVTLSSNTAVASSQKGDYLTTCIGWGAGAAFGMYTSVGISGGHINPAVSLVMVIFRGFPFRDFLAYASAQLLGAFFGALVVYGSYSQAINIYEGGTGVRSVPGTASIFSVYPMDYTTNVTAFFAELLATAVLIMVILAISDRRNISPPVELQPLVVFILVTALSASLTMQSGGAMNPARDLGPRLMTAIFYGKEVFTYRNFCWLWNPLIADFTGAIVGAVIYDGLIYTGEESVFNKPRRIAVQHGIPTLPHHTHLGLGHGSMLESAVAKIV